MDEDDVQRLADARGVRRVKVDPEAKAALPPRLIAGPRPVPFEQWAAQTATASTAESPPS